MLEQLYSLWNRFLSFFPESVGWLISLIVFLFLVKIFIDLVKKSFIWLLLLVLLIPTAIPLIKEIFVSLIKFLEFVLPDIF